MPHEDTRGARIGGRGRGGVQAPRGPGEGAITAGAGRARAAALGRAPGPPRAALRVPRRAPHRLRQAGAQVLPAAIAPSSGAGSRAWATSTAAN